MQLGVYLAKVVSGDLGYSYFFNLPVAAMIAAVIVVAILLAVPAIALRFGGRGGAEAQGGEGKPGGDEMRKLHDVSSCPRSGWTDDTILVRDRS